MRNKNKKKLLIKVISLSLVLFLNSSILGSVAKAAEVTIDETCYDEYYNDYTNYSALGADCELCIMDPDKVYKADDAECKKQIETCKETRTLVSYCETLSGVQQIECNECIKLEPGPARSTCETQFDLTSYKKACEKDFEVEYEICLEDSTQKCNSCLEKLDYAATGSCKDFTKFVDEIKAEVKNNFDAKYVDKLNQCLDDEFVHTDRLEKCQTSDFTETNNCLDTATSTKESALSACVDTKKAGMDSCESKQKEFINSLCGSFSETEKTDCQERNQNTLLAIYGQCTTPVLEADQRCRSKAENEYNKATTDCLDENFAAKKDKACFDGVAEEVKKECLPKCGDGEVASEYGEECDLGKDKNGKPGKDCDANCKKIECGNNRTDEGEECDEGKDKNGKPGIPCSSDCKHVDLTDRFEVSKYLKIEEGQSYLESSETEEQKKVTLKKGLIFFLITGIEYLTKIIGSFALFFIILGGIILMVSHGNSSMQQKGKRIIMYAILGLVVAFLSLVIVTFVQSLFYTT